MVGPSLAAIEAAAQRIDTVFLDSPQFASDALNEALELQLVCKVETLNPIRSFKGRGASWLVQRLLERGNPARIVCASAGNFGQGVAYACRSATLPLTVFAAKTANPLKLERMRALGAEMRLAGRDFDAAKAAARRFAEERAYTFVEDARDPETAEGAGTIGLELLTYPAWIDCVLVPLGNGALINGVGLAMKASRPKTRIIGVVAAGAPAMDLSWRAGRPTETEHADTIADGIGVRVPVPEALETMRDTVDDIVQVSDDTILEAMRLAHRTLGVVLEPAGAAGLAAATVFKEQSRGQVAATILCGGNLTEKQITQWLS